MNKKMDIYTTTECSNKNKKAFPTEDLFIIGFDNAKNGDCTVLTINRIRGSKIEVAKTYYNEGALEMYKRLTN